MRNIADNDNAELNVPKRFGNCRTNRRETIQSKHRDVERAVTGLTRILNEIIKVGDGMGRAGKALYARMLPNGNPKPMDARSVATVFAENHAVATHSAKSALYQFLPVFNRIVRGAGRHALAS